MGLISHPTSQQSPNANSVDQAGPVDALGSDDALVRRRAIKQLNLDDNSASLLLELLFRETTQLVIEAAFDRLLRFCQHSQRSGLIVEQVVARLPEMDAGCRNCAILFLSALPDEMEKVMPAMMTSSSKDLQLYALDILRGMSHPHTSAWLAALLQQKLHVNVLISGLERAADCQCMDLIPVIKTLSADAYDDPSVAFALTLTLERLGEMSEYA